MQGHLVRRGTTYWFRRRVPGALVERLGRLEIHRSLRTASAREAAIRGRRAWLATERVFNEMVRNPKMLAAQARLLIDQLLQEPLLASPTADELVEALRRPGDSYPWTLFNMVAVDMLMEMPPEDRAVVAAHMDRIVSRTELDTARQARDLERLKTQAAMHYAASAHEHAADAETRAAEAERVVAQTEVARQVSARLAELGASPAPAPVQDAPPFPSRGCPRQGQGRPQVLGGRGAVPG